jgi:poly(hydroxyalkanoate) granule-associated protein
MVKKFRQTADTQAASAAGPFDSGLANQVKDSAQQIWLAGMGAFAKAQAEGRQVFEALVKEGASLQKKTQTAAEERFGDVTGRMSSMADDVSARAGQHWDKLETIFEERTAKAMKRLGVPSSKDVAALSARIEELSAKVARLSKGAAKTAAPRKSAAASGTARAAAKRAAARKST